LSRESKEKGRKQEKDKHEGLGKASEAILNRMMEDVHPRGIKGKDVIDLDTLSTQRQDRFWHALKERYQYNTSIKHGQDFLLKHVSTKLSFVIMYVDIVGSTNMSMALPADKLVTIIRAFSYEMSSVIESYDGYVLKYVGDAVIAFFPPV
jgi:adenylate cyclase